jgi:hypothetical protein
MATYVIKLAKIATILFLLLYSLPCKGDTIFSDDFNDNSIDYGKWTEMFTSGTWEETNQRAEFLLYESGVDERYEGIESSEFSVSLSDSGGIIVSCEMLSDVGSTGSVGFLWLEVTDGTNWITAYYRLGTQDLGFQDNNDASPTILNGDYPDGVWDNEIRIYGNRYLVRMDTDSSGWIYDPIFAANSDLTVRIYIQVGGSSPSLYQHSAFDNVSVESVGEFALNQPTAGEALVIGQSYSIEWSKPGDIDSVNIMLSRDNGFSWNTVSAGETGDSYLWQVDGPAADEALICIYDVPDSNFADTTDGTFFILALSNLLFEDDFDDNSIDYTKWSEIFDEGAWQETNQHMEFMAYEQNHYEGVESQLFNVSLSPDEGIIVSWDLISNISSNGAVGHIVLQITDGTNWIEAQYYRWTNDLRYWDSNDGDLILLNPDHSDGTWNNEIRIFSDRYFVRMDADSSDWIYDPIFSSGSSLRVNCILRVSGTTPSSYTRSGFDNVIVQSVGTEPLVLLSPKPNESLVTEQDFPVRWAKSADIDSVNIMLSRNGGMTWYPLSLSNSDNIFDWSITGPETDEALVCVYDVPDSNYADTTADIFTIIAPPFDPNTFVLALRPKPIAIKPIIIDSMPIKDWRASQGIYCLAYLYPNGFVDIHRGYTDGAFDSLAYSTISIDSGTVDMSIGDVDRDGNQDILVANDVTNVISIHFGNGDATFTSNPDDTIQLANSPNSIELFDVNRDGALDILLTMENPHEVKIFPGNGDGSFTDTGTAVSVESPPSSVTAAKFDADNILDLAVAHGDTGAISIFAGYGDGDFEVLPIHSEVTGGHIGELLALDMDIDGKIDLAASHDNGSAFITMLMNDGFGLFSRYTYPTVLDSHRGMAVGDFTGDGAIDIALASAIWDSIIILIGIPDAEAGGLFSYPAIFEAGTEPADIISGDFNFDGMPDLIALNSGSQDITRFDGLINSGINTDITIVYPNGGEELYIGRNKELTWLKGEGVVVMDLQISRDSGITWETITHNCAGDGYKWRVCGPATDSALFRIYDATVPTRTDTSDASFLISEQDFICGDANADIVVNVSDAVRIINYVFVGGDPPDPLDSGDANCDGIANVSDAVWIINYVFVGGNIPCDTNGDNVPDC